MRRGTIVALLVLCCSATAAQESPQVRPGIGVDARGGAVIDPSENVKALNEAGLKRQDDLRAITKELFDAKLAAVVELNAMRSKYDELLLKAATDRLDEQAKLRAEFATAIAATEKARVDAIRLVDKNAVDVATAGSVATASALAKTVQDTAENSRKLVETTALETNRNIQQQFAAVTALLVPIGTRLTALEQSAAEGTGRQKFQDPAVAALVTEVRALAQSQQAAAGAKQGSSDLIGYIVGLGGFAIALFMFFQRKDGTRGRAR